MYWVEGENIAKESEGGEDMLDRLCAALPGIRDTFNKSWRSVLVDNNTSTSQQL